MIPAGRLADKYHGGVPTDHFLPWRERHAAFDHRGRITALVAEGEDPAASAVDVVEPEVEPLASGEDPAGDGVEPKPVTVAPDHPMGHGKTSTTHSHSHSAMGTQGDDKTHTHEHTHDGDASHSHHQTTATVTPITSGAQLAAKVAELRARQAERPDLERSRVIVAAGNIEVDLPVRWDDDAWDPYTWNPETGSYGAKGAFVSTDPLTAAADGSANLVDNPGAAWHAILCVEGLKTDEDPAREIVPGACQIPDLPVSLRLQIHDEGGHWGAVTCGRTDTMERQAMQGYNAIAAGGVFGTDEHGQLAQLLVTEQTQRFISIDPRDVDMEIIEITVSTGGIYDSYDEMETVVDWWVRYTNLTIGAATIVATPALQQAVITLESVELPETPIAVANAQSSGGNVEVEVNIAADGGPIEPPASWFEDPKFHVGDSRLARQKDGKYACPLTITDGGHIFGHVCYWGQRHTGFRDRIVTPPKSKAALAYFLTGPGVKCNDGTTVYGIGQITMGCGHADLTLGHAAAKAHYDGGYGAIQVADVRAGQDDFGVWISGAMRPDLTPEQVRKFRATKLSGDWRGIGGNPELIAVLAGVAVPGFPITREEVLVASAEQIDQIATRARLGQDGEVQSLVAAGCVERLSTDDRLAQLERHVDLLVRERQARAVDEGRASLAALVQ